MVRSISQQYTPYLAHSRSTRHDSHAQGGGSSKDKGSAIGALIGFGIGIPVGIYVGINTAVAATGASEIVLGPAAPAAGIAAGIAAGVGVAAALTGIGSAVGGAIGTIVGDDDSSSSKPAQAPGDDSGDPGGTIGIGPFDTGAGGDQGGDQGGSGSCFLGGTPVVLANGRRLPIEQVALGELLVAQDPVSGDVSAQPATGTFAHHVRSTLLLNLSDGTTLHTTRHHRFFVPERGFLPAGRLTPGMSVVTLGNQYLTVLGSTPVAGEATVYNLEVAQAHTFFVGPQGVWVHNDKIDEPPN